MDGQLSEFSQSVNQSNVKQESQAIPNNPKSAKVKLGAVSGPSNQRAARASANLASCLSARKAAPLVCFALIAALMRLVQADRPLARNQPQANTHTTNNTGSRQRRRSDWWLVGRLSRQQQGG